jgi:DNA-binding response OmpR family regulator
MHVAIDRALVNFTNPFCEALLDSILATDLDDIHYAIQPWQETDTIHYVSHWEKSGTFLYPGINVWYTYSPFEQKGVVINASIPPQPLFGKMAIQLLVALGLILLLIGCLVFQIKTIMKQKKLGELRESFVNTMIHELKRPVQTLKAFVSFLGDKEMRSDEEVAEQVVQDSMFELDNLSVYLTKLKDMMCADSESTSLRPVKFNLKELIDKVVRLTHIPAGKNVQLSATYEMGSPWIEADPVHIANILGNLIENAVKYSDREVEITINAHRKGRELWLNPDLVLLDINMPGLNGFEVAEKIREKNKHTLIFFLSDRSDKSDRLKGFSLKGNDYLAKPFYPEELLARIQERFYANPAEQLEEETYCFAQTVFNYNTNELRTDNSKTLITSRQAEILRILAKNLNTAVSRDFILSAVWGNDSYANSLALNVQITYLRKALSNDSSVAIVSLTKKGYVLSVNN